MIPVLSFCAAFLCLVPLTDIGSTNYHLLRNGINLVNIFAGCCGTVLVLSAAAIIARTTRILSGFFGFVGRNSLHFMASEYNGFSLFTELFQSLFRIQDPSLPYQSFLFTLYIIVLCAAVYLVAPIFNKVIGSVAHGFAKRKR